ncbi:hypothetical protein CN378_01955 [Bacillus sp. AFS015802]|nr:hypothetical protein CN378_01955 [Bacillus sp. AFS015802]
MDSPIQKRKMIFLLKMIINFDKILIEDENYSQDVIYKRVGTKMVWFLILFTVTAYVFMMKYVLSNVMKNPAQRKNISSYQANSKSFVHSNLIATDTTR